jgi:hypothetical protein
MLRIAVAVALLGMASPSRADDAIATNSISKR